MTESSSTVFGDYDYDDIPVFLATELGFICTAFLGGVKQAESEWLTGVHKGSHKIGHECEDLRLDWNSAAVLLPLFFIGRVTREDFSSAGFAGKSIILSSILCYADEIRIRIMAMALAH